MTWSPDSNLLKDLTNLAFKVAVRVLSDRDTALDVAQDVIVNLQVRGFSSKTPVKVRAYVARSAFNRALNSKRDSRKRLLKLAENTPLAVSIPSDGTAEMKQRREILGSALDNLAGRQREALSLRFFGEMPISEVAAVMNISEGAVKTHLARGLIHLKNRLVDFEGVL